MPHAISRYLARARVALEHDHAAALVVDEPRLGLEQRRAQHGRARAHAEHLGSADHEPVTLLRL